LIDAWHTLGSQEDKGITFINGASEEHFVGYPELDAQARRALGYLQNKGLLPGDELVFQLEDNASFVVLFWACLLGKILPVPLSTGTQDDHKLKLVKVWQTLRNPYLVGDAPTLKRLENFCLAHEYAVEWEQIKNQHILIQDALAETQYGEPQSVQAEDLAYIQYSSGSTGEPKGVMLTHANLIANAGDIAARSEIVDRDALLSWMPLTHDMGLICFHLTGVVSGISQYIIPTPLFIRRPLLWLEKASTHRASLLYSPNFGYQYFLDAFEGTEKKAWDLSSVRLIYNGAEPISTALCHHFMETLAPYGLQPSVMFPGYGLAEASVAVTLPTPGAALTAYVVKRDRLNVGDSIEEITDPAGGVSLVEVGYPIDHCAVRICGTDDEPLAENVIGHIQIKGHNVTSGYYRNSQATSALLTPDGWVKTGDLGFMRNGKLVIAGRAKNLIIINGQNYYPQDIEKAAQAVEGVTLGKVVACGQRNYELAKDELFLFILFKNAVSEFLPLVTDIRNQVWNRIGLVVDQVIAVRKIPKTTSGKVQHFKLLEQYRAGAFDEQLSELKRLAQPAGKYRCFDGLSTSEKLALIWKELFSRVPLSPDENFVQAGMNSMKATRLASVIAQALEVRISVKQLFEFPTLRQLSQWIDAQKPQTLDAIESIEKQEYYEVSDAQQRFWVLDQYETEQSPFHLGLGYELRGSVQLPALFQAWETLVDRHESLRTTFITVNGAPRQKINTRESIGFKPEWIDLRAEPQGQAQAVAMAREEANRPFDLSKGPLLRVKLIQVADQSCFFLLTIHHSIVDGWSLGVIWQEMKELYRRFTSRNEDALTPLAFQYKDYVQWQQGQLEKSRALDKAYWLEVFSGEIPRLHLPTYSSPESIPTSRGKNLPFIVSPDVAQGLRQLSLDHNATLFISLMGVLNVVFYQYTGQSDIVLGTDTSGRNHPSLENQVGYYLNTLALRTQMDRQESFGQLLARVKTQVLGAFEHQAYPFDVLIADLGLNQDLRRSPLFNVLVILQNFEQEMGLQNFSEGIEVRALEDYVETSLIDLHLEFVERGEALELNIRFNTGLFQEAQIVRLAAHVEHVARQVIQAPGQPVSSYELVTEAEKKHFLEENRTQVAYPNTLTVVSLFEAQVEKTLDSVAVVCGEKSLTCKELNEAANRLAHFLVREAGIRRHDRVGLLLQRSEQMVVAMLAVLKAGAAYVPIDPNYPAARIQYLAQDSGIQLIYTDETSCSAVELPVPQLKAESIQPLLSAYPGENLASGTQPEDLAYVMYTSGTTGQPKGVMIEHRSLLDYTLTFTNYFNITATDTVIQQASLSFDTAVEEIFPALCTSAKLVIAPEGGQNVAQLLSIINDQKATVLSTTPLVINEINQEADKVRGLRVLISGGDVLKPTYISHLIQNSTIYNTYGPTESTVCTTFHPVASLTETAIIGKPIANRQVYIVNEQGQLVPPGVTGELHIGGEGLARGYVNAHAAQEQGFIVSPFSQTRLYKTGDAGRWLEDGNIEFRGRTDSQVKIRGHRVEVEEVEKALICYPAVKEVIVLAREDEARQKYLVAYYIGNQITTPELRKFLVELLPDYMVPAYFVPLSTLPLLPNGKVDRKSLPDPQAAGAVPATAYQSPRNYPEKVLVEIWQEVLRKERIGVLDHFFELGGNSIKATQVVTRLYTTLGIRLPLRHVFIHPVIRDLAEVIAELTPDSTTDIERLAGQSSYAVSHAQQRMWVLDQFEKNQLAYQLSWAYEFYGQLDQTAFGRAFEAIVARHESLRTTFVELDGEPRQVIHDMESFGFRTDFLDLREIKDREDIARQVAEEEANAGFDLAKGPLLRVKVVQLEENRHLFLLAMHHIVADGWSINVLAQELVTFYQAFASGQQVRLPALAIQYKEFASWQNARLQVDRSEKHRTYWLAQFAQEVPVLALPTDFPRPPIQTYHGDTISFVLDKRLKERVATLAQQHDASPFMVLLAAVKALLFRYTGQEDLVVGTPVAGRVREELENQIGLYLNTLALRTAVSTEDNFESLLGKVRETTLHAYEHQQYPFDRLVDELELTRDMSRSPLFDVMVGYQQTEEAHTQLRKLDGITVSPYERDSGVSQFDLSIDFMDEGDSLAVQLNYNTDLFTASRMGRLVQHFKSILTQALINTQCAVSQLDYLSEAEKKRLCGDFNEGSVVWSPEQTITELFESQVEKTPHRTALRFAGQTLTYRELNEKANQLAHYLRATFRLSPDQLVGVMVGRSERMVLGVLGILKTGAAYVPIDPDYPIDRIRHLIEDSRVKILLTDAKIPESVQQTDLTVVRLDEIEAELASSSSNNLVSVAKPENLAYVIYTSASTGLPKGVMVEHRSLVSIAQSWRQAYQLDTFDVRLLQMASMSFDVFFGDLCRALLHGGELIICPTELRLDIEGLYQLMDRHQINILESTPALILPLMEYVYEEQRDISFLKLLILGSDKWLVEDYKKLQQRFGRHTRILNSYGTTETSIDSSFYEASAAHLPGGNVPIGKPLANTQYYILDKQQSLVPIGVTGELYIGGAGVARGYWDRPGLTEERFVTTPLLPKERLYRTGDLARWLEDGHVDFLGRNDFQVKIRGYRIELGEIENALSRHEAVDQVVVVAKTLGDGENHLVAYVLFKREETTAELRKYLSQYLPEYMVPAYVVPLSAMPITPHGKVDLKALPHPETVSGGDPIEVVPARNATEEKLMDIWRDILKKEVFGIRNNFFELGGHSLKATQVIARIHKALRIRLDLRTLFERPTIEQLAQVIMVSAPGAFAEINRIPEGAHYEVSPAQKRLWILDQFKENQVAYNMPIVYHLAGPLDRSAFERALAALVDRHESLRTQFITVAGEPKQTIQPATGFKLVFNDLQDESAKEELAGIAVREDLEKPFNLSEGPLLRAQLMQLEAERHLFLFNMHHIISDGCSVDILLREVITLYNAFREGKSNPLQTLPIQYKDFTYWQQEQLKSPLSQSHKAYWLDQFAEAVPVLELPTDYPSPAVKTFHGSTLTDQLEPELSDLMTDFAQQQGASLFVVLLASVKALLYRYTGQEDIVIGSPAAGRNHADLENQVGFFVNTLALRTRFGAAQHFEELLHQVKTNTLQAYEHQLYPFDWLVENLSLSRDLSRSPLFDVMVVLQNTNGEPIPKMDGVTMTVYPQPLCISKFDLTFTFSETANGIGIEAEYNTDLFAPARIRQLIGHYKQLLRVLIRESKRPIHALTYLSESEQKQLLVDFNQTAMAYPTDQTVVGLFEAQVEKTPDAVAVIDPSASLTYRELNACANRVAAYLRHECAIQPGARIGLMADKSVWMMAGIWGILKAGGAYVPIDPAYPTERKAYIIQDSQISFLLTDRAGVEAFAGVRQLDIQSLAVGSGSTQNLPADTLPGHCIYVIYTSGTTGTPKGVQIAHQSVVNLSCWLGDLIYTRQAESLTALLTASINFDASVQQLFAPLLFGSRLVLIADHHKKDPDRFVQALRQYQVDVLDITPAYLNVLLWALKEKAEPLAVRYTLVGGEALSNEVCENHRLGSLPGSQLINVYGITEATVNSTYEMVHAGRSSTASIGKPLSNTRLYILDAYFQAVPIGVPGELYIGGDGVVMGYLNRQELTKEKFIEHPLEAGSRLFRTGDRARWLADGSVEFLGRKDHQVKIRGYRIELGEIESVLLKHPEVEQALVLARAVGPDEKELVAYLVTASEVATEALKAHAGQFLPDYMIPPYVVCLPAFPLTTNGKTDRNALPLPSILSGRQSVAPRNQTERKLAAIWATVLGRNQIGIGDHFFELGGHSLKAIQVISRVHKELGLKIELRDLFANPTIAALAEKITNVVQAAYEPIVPIQEQAYYPVSYAQKGLWILDQFEDASVAYTMSGAYALSGHLDKKALERAFSTLIERHESLRTHFLLIEGELKQKVREQSSVDFSLDCVELRNHSLNPRALEPLLEQAFSVPFDLERDPLLRAKLFWLEDEQHLLLFSMHHIISDGWSTGVLVQEMIALYNAYQNGEDNPLPPLPIQYKDYTAWQQQLLKSDEMQAHRNYWLQQLGGEIPALTWLNAGPRPASKTFRGEAHCTEVPEDVYEKLKTLSFQQGSSLFMTLLAAVKALLHRYTSQEDLIVGTPIAGRDWLELENQIGFYVNSLALRTRVKGEESFQTLLEKVKQTTLDAYEHKHYPFDCLVADLNREWDASRAPFFDVMVVLQTPEQNQPIASEMNGLLVNSYPLVSRESKFDLVLNFIESAQKLQLDLQYKTDLFQPDFIQQFTDRLLQLLVCVTENPLLKIEDIDFEENNKEGAEDTMLLNQFSDFSFD